MLIERKNFLGEFLNEFFVTFSGQRFLVKANNHTDALEQAFTSLVYR